MAGTNNDTNNLEVERKTLVERIVTLREAELKLQKEGKKLSANEAIELNKKVKEVKTITKLLTEQNDVIKDQMSNYTSVADGLSSITDSAKDFKNELKKGAALGIELSKSIGSLDAKDALTEDFKAANILAAKALGLQADIAALDKDDIVNIKAKSDEYERTIGGLNGFLITQLSSYDKMNKTQQDIYNTLGGIQGILKSNFKIALSIANIEKDEKEFLEELQQDYKSINKSLQKVLYTVKQMFSGVRGFAAGILLAISAVANKFSELGRNLGFTLTQMVGLKSEMLLMNAILGEASSEAVQELGKQLGGIGNVTSGMALDAGIMAYNFNLSGDEAGYLSVAFGKLQGQSYETGKNTIEFVRQLSYANGVAPSQVMKDIAHNTEAMALFSKDGGKNIATAALQAAKLGVNLSTTAKLAEHLLDYQSSVDDEMEASVLLGRQLNLGKARELAYNNDIAGATNEALKAVGGIGEWEKMSYYQRQATAKALGISAEEMQQMVSHQKDLNGMNGVSNQLYSQTADTLSAIANTTLGKITGGLGGMLTTLGNVNFGFQAFGYNMFGKGGAIPALLRWLGLMKSVPIVAAEADAGNAAVGAFTGVASRNATTKSARAFKTQQPIQPQTGATPKSFLDKVGSPTQMYAVAAALLAFGAAIWMISKAFQNFGEVTNGGKALGLFAAAIVGMGVAIIGISYALTALSATGALEVVAIGMLAFGAAILMIGGGIKLMGDGFTTMTTALNPLIALIPQLFLLALAFSAVAASMALLGTASIVALPALAVLGFAAGAGSAMLSGGKGDTSQQLLDQIVGLREDLNKGKVAVFLDGIKVNKELAVVKAQNKLAGT